MEKALVVTHGAQSSDSDVSDFTGDEGAAVKLFWLPPGGVHVSRLTYKELNPVGDKATEHSFGVKQADSPLRLCVFLPDMSASTLKG